MFRVVADESYVAGDDFGLSSSAGGPGSVSVAALPGGGFVAVWARGNGASSQVLRGRIFDNDGQAVGPEFQFSDDFGGLPQSPSPVFAYSPSVTALQSGNFVVTWILEDTSTGAFFIVTGRMFDPEGHAVGRQFSVSNQLGKMNPVVADLADGGFVVSWENGNAFQRFDANGAKVGAAISLGGEGPAPDIVGLAGGGFVVSWYSDSPIPDLGGRAQIFRADGTSLGPPFQVNAFLPGRQFAPALAARPDGGFVATWVDEGVSDGTPTGHGGIWLQQFDAAGARIGGEVRVNTSVEPYMSSVAIELVPDTGFLVTWSAGTGYDHPGPLRAQLVDFSGAMIGTEFAITQGGAADQWNSDVAVLTNGNAIVGWDEMAGVRAQILHLVLHGSGDADLFAGTANSDFYFGEGGNDQVSGAAADDILNGGDGLDTLDGGDGSDTLDGGSGNDTLDGGAGDDTMTGGLGDDTYRVDGAGDIVNELADQGMDTLTVGFSYTLANGSALENLATIDATAVTAINLTGNDLSNLVSGNAGGNVLDGGMGADALVGLGGSDWYFVDNALDSVTEYAAEGAFDRIFASVSYAQGAGVYAETLTTTDETGAAAINLTGNELTNLMRGNTGANVLNGGGGADSMAGLAGNDWYYVDDAGDVVAEGAAEGSFDRIFASGSYAQGAGVYVEALTTSNEAGTTAINLTGNELANIIRGNAGANVLDGGAGADTLAGLGGNDFYQVDNALDVVTEGAAEGAADRIFASVSYTQGAGVYVETLSTANDAGTASINLTGNELANFIQGNAGANMLDGGGGADTMIGLAGSDWYYVDNTADAVTEGGAEGTFDRILASVSYRQGDGVHVEALSTTYELGTAGIELSGNELANIIRGNAGDNVLNGGGAADTLIGLGGADVFRFTTSLGGGNVDAISDYNVADDTIQIDDAVFVGLAAGALAVGAFNTGATATQADDRIIYNSATGALLFDVDGLGGAAAVQFATLGTGLALTSADFIVI